MLDYLAFVLVVLSFSMLFCGMDASSRRGVIHRRRVHRGNPHKLGVPPFSKASEKQDDLRRVRYE